MDATDRATEITLDITGMTCASCVTRIERVLGRQEGVERAAVNLATHTAHVRTTLQDPSSLLAAVERAGYGARIHAEAREDAEPAGAYARRLAVAATLTYLILVLAFVFRDDPGAQIASWILATPVVFWCGAPFLRSSIRHGRRGVATMDTLIAVGSVAAYAYSVWAILRGRTEAYFDTGAVIVTLVLLGKHLESRARARAGDAARALLERGAKDARLLRDGREVAVPIDQVRPGDLAVVLPGEKIPSDGVVREGVSWVDLSMLTGESSPADVAPGDEVTGASVNGRGRLLVEITRVGSETKLAEVVRLLREAQGSKPPIQRLADRVSAVFVPRILVLAGLVVVFGTLLFPGGLPTALLRATAVLLVACPCALGLATPAAIMAGTGRAAEMGVLFKGGEVFEAARSVDTVLLDKTGTVTEGRMRLASVVATGGWDAERVLALAAATERGSEHPIAAAVVAGAKDRGVAIPEATDLQIQPGAGALATVGAHAVRVGRPEGLPPDLAGRARDLASGGLTVFGVWCDGRPVGLLGAADRIKASSRETVDRMRGFGFDVRMVTGDRREAAGAIAREAGIDEVAAEVFPEGKVEEVGRLQASGHHVAFVGDGINDAPALAAADLGVALGTGTDVAIEAADVMVLGGDPSAVADALFLARQTYRVIFQNLTWAFAYNALMIPMAIVGRLTPVAAAAAMALSSVTVVANALRLRFYRQGASTAGTGRSARVEAPADILARHQARVASVAHRVDGSGQLRTG